MIFANLTQYIYVNNFPVKICWFPQPLNTGAWSTVMIRPYTIAILYNMMFIMLC